jgi:hypothetical protein
VAWHLIRSEALDPQGPEIEAAFIGENSLRFSDLLPLAGEVGDPSTKVTPITLYRCKAHPGEHPMVDLLAFRLLSKLGLGAKNDLSLLPASCGFDRCDAVIQPSRWSARFDPLVTRRVVTRVALGRSTGTAASGNLYSMELVEPVTNDETHDPLRLTAAVRLGDPGQRALLEQLQGATIRVGHGRNRGLGSLELKILAAPEVGVTPAWDRVLAFNQALRALDLALSQALSCSPIVNADEVFLPLCAVTPFAHTGPDDHPLRDLGLIEEPFLRVITTDRVGGFDQRSSRPRSKTLHTVVGRGSMFVYRFSQAPTAEQVEGWAGKLRRGVGPTELADEGYGQFYVAHDDHRLGLPPIGRSEER